MPGGLLTDLYEITMAASYLRAGMEDPATFSLFVRSMPAERGFLVSAGLEDALHFLETFSFDDADLEHLERAEGFDRSTLDALRGLRFTGDVWAVPEGRVVLAAEPLLEVTAPIAEAQLVETALLNIVSFQTGAASKAARCVLAARGRPVVDFAFRRTHGIDAAMAFARSAAIAGFSATSNVEASRRFGIRASGTMAHSFVEAFGDDRFAFDAFARDHPERRTFLVDTFDTLDGVRAAIDVIEARRIEPPVAIRLDSGDLAALARSARAMLDAAGHAHVSIFASGGLDEYLIDDLLGDGAPIDAFGVGTRVGVSADVPALETVYKLVEYAGRGVMKYSTGKRGTPGRKQVFRGDRIAGDVLARRDEQPPGGTRALLEPVMRDGRRMAASPSIDDARRLLAGDLDRLDAAALAVRDPRAPTVSISPALEALTAEVSSRDGR